MLHLFLSLFQSLAQSISDISLDIFTLKKCISYYRCIVLRSTYHIIFTCLQKGKTWQRQNGQTSKPVYRARQHHLLTRGYYLQKNTYLKVMPRIIGTFDMTATYIIALF